LIAFFGFVGQITAATTGTVTATVTVQNISLTVADGTITYGTMSTSENKDTTTAAQQLNDSQTATNNGNITENFNIKGIDSTNWELADTAGADTYTHKFCTSNCDTSPTWTAMNEDTYTSLTTGITSSGNQVFDLQIGTPTSSTNFTSQSVDVTVQAVAP
jgi:hypothetical protein